METVTPSKPKKAKPSTESLRIKRETKRRIVTTLGQINKKEFGRPVTPDQLVSLAIDLVTEQHLESLRQGSLTAKDRFEQRYKEFCSTNGRVSKDDFLATLLK